MRLIALLALGLLVGCADPCADGSMLDGPGGLVVTEEEHPEGWGREACTSCHVIEALHRQGCDEGVDLQELRDTVSEEGPESCGDCHGSNGVDE